MIALTQVIKCICDECGWEWQPRDDSALPKRCPKCLTYDWNLNSNEQETKRTIRAYRDQYGRGRQEPPAETTVKPSPTVRHPPSIFNMQNIGRRKHDDQ